VSERVFVKFHTSRQGTSCTSRSAPWCTRRINPGERYCVASWPPGHDLGGDHWATARVCLACADWFGYRETTEVAS
jgi:hypothetical protein